MYNTDSEFDKGFDKGLSFGMRIGFMESKIQYVSKELGNISESLESEGANIAGIIIEIGNCIETLDNATELLTDI